MMSKTYYITIYNPNDYSIKDYQYSLNLKQLSEEGKIEGLNQYFNNVIYNDLNNNQIHHWCEHDYDQNNTGIVWIKIPYIEQNGQFILKITIDDQVIDNGNGKEVFLFFDDFELLDLDTWELFNEGGEGVDGNMINVVDEYK